ncbi:trehalose-phosphatase [Acinetobacter variabilis]|uniref:trehalose-phosphatase n=1 Tax=Acinetobacter TaxID=469 RepID=UPI000CDC036E|nr:MULTISPECIES: trehalose-phosphatase [Acinetobacter]AUX90174.1 trehalose-phosphatase [Acinetobacter sp. ACNIH1]MCU4312864.1 trehalose-phosphatase [Acinetobacter variabilis]MCU4366258.1 trehalose-phosphatase [Acinetobacter variabilis]MCU4376280.1 trehalose-phosphatase [Acinetobacter variabilis]
MSDIHREQNLEDSSSLSYISPKMILNDCNLNMDSNQVVLFLDIDGTISEFHPDPDKSIIHPEIINILKNLQQYIQLILVTGRSILQAQKLIHPLQWNIAGSHGLELIYQADLKTLISLNKPQLQALKQYIQEQAVQIPDLRIEVKDYSVALHFREHPQLEDRVHAFALECLNQFSDFELKAGKYVFELVPKGANKGSAIQQIIQQYHLTDHYHMFIGDDLTDEAGFKVINALHGCSIKVGLGQTLARYRLENVSQVQAFLKEFLNVIEVQEQQPLEKSHV